MTKRIHVVAGIIWDKKKESILISKRPQKLHKGGFWEFPGGKVEVDESSEDALARELYEELNIQCDSFELFDKLSYDYPEKSVYLEFYNVFSMTGDIRGNEGQEFRWVLIRDLVGYEFPEANIPIMKKLIG